MKNFDKSCGNIKNKRICKKIKKLCPKRYEENIQIEMGQTNGFPVISTKVILKCKY